MSIVIDFHSHILPGIDDGSQSLAQSMAMLQMEAAQGIRGILATPHFYPQYDSPEGFLAARTHAEERLREEMEKHTGLPELYVGAEVFYYPNMSASDILPAMAIAGKRGILIEMPRAPWTEAMYRELENIYVKCGLVPIVAHVDRYISRFHTFGIPQRLADLPVMVQANAAFFLNRTTSSMALRMLKQDRIHLLGSDCHNTDSRKPNMEGALDLIRKRLGEEALARVHSYGRDLLRDR